MTGWFDQEKTQLQSDFKIKEGELEQQARKTSTGKRQVPLGQLHVNVGRSQNKNATQDR